MLFINKRKLKKHRVFKNTILTREENPFFFSVESYQESDGVDRTSEQNEQNT